MLIRLKEYPIKTFREGRNDIQKYALKYLRFYFIFGNFFVLGISCGAF